MAHPTRIGDRYEIHALLGSGGMASVYRATDKASGREVALKQLRLNERDGAVHSGVAALFEREFHTLKQLSHPRVIAVYDYGVDASGQYYTMELLDGGDLYERAPLPWRELCALLFDVCSSLALLHSRRLLHRDISPRNIRCTSDGKAKLIDFGAMAPMTSGGAHVVGTPAFMPPETLHRLAIDARADVFSLGATFYTALTGQLAYPARSFAEVLSAWTVRPLPPSARIEDIPPALDDLVLSMLNLEPSRRPQSAYAVMQRLAAIAGLDASESDAVVRAYLSTPQLVGRGELLEQLEAAYTRTRDGQSAGALVRGTAGIGRSRVLDAVSTFALTQGATVLRAAASGKQGSFLTVRALAEAWLAEMPESTLSAEFPELNVSQPPPRLSRSPDAGRRPQLRAFGGDGDDSRAGDAFCRFFLAASRTRSVVLAVDDVQRIDPASASVLADALDRAKHGNLFVVLTVESGATGLAIDVLSRRCKQLELRPLSLDETQELLGSLFGDVANLELIAREIHGIAAGNPGATMELAQHLVDRGRILYSAGSWTLPARLEIEDLPRNDDDARRARVAALSPRARMLAEAQVVAFEELFTLEEYRALAPDVDPAEIDAAVSELVASGALTTDDGTYALANRLWADTFKMSLDPPALRERHRALAELYRDRLSSAFVHHAFASGLEAEAIAMLHKRFARHNEGIDHKSELEQNVTKLVPCYSKAVRAAIQLRHSRREVNELRRWAVVASLAAEGNHYWHEADAWFRQLEQDSGLDLWRADSPTSDPGERLKRALGAAAARFQATPAPERVYGPEEAIRLLAEYVVCSIGVGARALDGRLLESLVPLLQPFAALSPVLAGLRLNALASFEGHILCLHERARTLWVEALALLDGVSGAQMKHIDAVRNAIIYAIGMMDARCGVASATEFAARLDQDPYQRLSALGLRKIVLLQQGDFRGADQLRRQAEVLALQMRSPSMFQSLLIVELEAYSGARDLPGMQQAIEAMKGPAALYPGWIPHLREAQARFQLVRGDLAAAKSGFEACLRLSAFDTDGHSDSLPVWVRAHAGLAETLFDQGAIEESRRVAEEALRICDERGIQSHAYDLVRSLALAEAQLGDYDLASQRLERLIEKQIGYGVSGLHLGLSLEARAQIAIWAEDEPAFEAYAKRCAQAYNIEAQSALGARYENLVRRAMRRGIRVANQLGEFEAETMVGPGVIGLRDIHSSVLRAMLGAEGKEGRAKRAVRLICEATGSEGAHLFLINDRGPMLAASRPAEPPPDQLIELVRNFLQADSEQSGSMHTTMVTAELPQAGGELGGTRVHAGEAVYDLIALRCVISGKNTVAGVAALVPSEHRIAPLDCSQLLNTLASHLVLKGDITLDAIEAE